MKRQHGQALTEFLVAAIVIVPLFLLVPLLGKYIDIKHNAIGASRKLAFECTVRYADCGQLDSHPTFADEIRTRYFAGNNADVLSNDRPARDEITNEGNPLWVDRRGQPLLERYSHIGIRADQRTINPGLASAADVGNVAGPRRFGLDLSRGLFDARVQLRLSPTDANTSFLDQLDSLALNMQFHTAILTDAWAAHGPGGRGDTCRPGSNTVVGRITEASLCYPGMRTLDDSYYLAARLVVAPLAYLENASIDDFDFHDFADQRFVDRVPVNDPTGYSRLEAPR